MSEQNKALELPVRGFRDNWVESLIGNGQLLLKNPTEFSGYLNALYCLRMLELPASFDRHPDVARFQQGINLVISLLQASYSENYVR